MASPSCKRSVARSRARYQPAVFAMILLGAGVTHLVKPGVYDRIVPPQLPGEQRFWVIASGLAELGVGALVAIPRTRRTGATLAALLFVAVFPANIRMTVGAFRSSRATPLYRALTVARLPLQIPLVAGALSIRHNPAPRVQRH